MGVFLDIVERTFSGNALAVDLSSLRVNARIICGEDATPGTINVKVERRWFGPGVTARQDGDVVTVLPGDISLPGDSSRIHISHTGPAIAAPGGVANTGILMHVPAPAQASGRPMSAGVTKLQDFSRVRTTVIIRVPVGCQLIRS